MVPGFRPIASVIVGDKAGIRHAAKVLDKIRVGQIPAVERSHIGKKEVIPPKKAVPAVLFVP
jgi:endonuclease YncB( thermonuclease family)